MSAVTLQAALREFGVACTVVADERLAVIVPSHASTGFDDPRLRRAALALLGAHGFTHLALELGDAVPENAKDLAPDHGVR